MASKSNLIREYAKANGVANIDFTTDVVLQDDSNGQGAYIKEWNLDIAQPTDEQLATYETVANTAESNANVIQTRKELYGSPEKQLENIIENGLQAEIDRVNQIKTDNPKSE